MSILSGLFGGPAKAKTQTYKPDEKAFAGNLNKASSNLDNRSLQGLTEDRLMGRVESPAQIAQRQALAQSIGQGNAFAQSQSQSIGGALAASLALRNQEEARRQSTGAMTQAKLVEDQQNLGALTNMANADRNAQIQKEMLKANAINEANKIAMQQAQAQNAYSGQLMGMAGTIGGALVGGPVGAAIGNKLFSSTTPTETPGMGGNSGGGYDAYNPGNYSMGNYNFSKP